MHSKDIRELFHFFGLLMLARRVLIRVVNFFTVMLPAKSPMLGDRKLQDTVVIICLLNIFNYV